MTDDGSNKRMEDEHQTLRAWSIADFAPGMPDPFPFSLPNFFIDKKIYVYHELSMTSTALCHTVTDSMCIDSLKQSIIGYCILHSSPSSHLPATLASTRA